MFIDIQGGTKKERETITDALWFSKKYWLPRHRDLAVEVTVDRHLEVDADVLEGCDDREYEIRVRRGLEHEDLLTAIFHEFVHIKQDVRREFPMFECTDIPYFDRPWEIEAYAEQEKMLEAYKKG